MGFVYANDKRQSDILNQYAAAHLAEELGGEVTLVDIGRSPVEAKLDQRCGIDAILTVDGCSYGVAMRMQPKNNWETFTIRCSRTSGHETEYLKTKRMLGSEGAIRPHYHLQGYFVGDQVFYGLAETAKLWEWIRANSFTVRRIPNGQDGNGFLAVPWDRLDGESWFKNFSRVNPSANY